MSRNKTSGRFPSAKRSLGQNFLIDDTVVRRIVDSLDVSTDDLVVEIGPGRGALTDRLAATGAGIFAIELDRDLAAFLRSRYVANENVRVIEADALAFDFGTLAAEGSREQKLKLVANLPYNISTPILRRLFMVRGIFSVLTVMVQKEVAERILAKPGDSSRGFLTVVLERGFECESLFTVPPGAFHPVPKVTSAVIRLRPKTAVEADGPSNEEIEGLAGAAFSQKRKTIRNNLQAAPPELKRRIDALGGAEEILKNAGIDPSARAEALTGEDWESLASAVFREAR